ncbi:unnamed protein product [Cyprideis torosa]|uniref:Uncharacterized protein n=1 Tax=Cyprideis torosa TaxID=163714 RepID=A0A7R8WC54_9CRUS|nr:unnamed protein product [Cyprideis torosa]CAG0890334.1 unnamed protein product [Cyprideis torosa]
MQHWIELRIGHIKMAKNFSIPDMVHPPIHRITLKKFPHTFDQWPGRKHARGSPHSPTTRCPALVWQNLSSDITMTCLTRGSPHAASLERLPPTSARIVSWLSAADKRLQMTPLADFRWVGEPVKGKTALMEAAAEGHYPAALWLLREFGTDVNAEDFESQAPLHYACKAGRPLIVSLLLREGALVDKEEHVGQTPMIYAAAGGHPITLRLLHRFGANPAATDAEFRTPLHFAADRGHTSSVACLLEMGAPLEAEDKNKRRPLHLACDKGHFPCARLLVNAGADVNARTADGYTPFLIAAGLNHVEILRLLAHSGADISLADAKDMTPLHFATALGHTSSVACLLEMGAPVEAEDKNKWRPLHLACDKGHSPCVRLLVNAGADVNARTADGYTPFLIAAGLNHVEILRLLAHSGADISLADDNRWTPLHFAAVLGHTSSVACLLEMGAPVEAEGKKERARPLHLACISGHTPCADLLLRAGANINARIRYGRTPLHLCSRKGHRAVVLLLLGWGAEVDCRQEGGYTALHWACAEGHVYVARDLVAHGADVNAKDRSDATPLIGASNGGHVETVEFLVREAKADLEGRENISGWTALAHAAQEGHTHVMEILLAAGAEVDARGSDGLTPLQWACMKGSLEGARLLIDHGADWTLADDFGVNAVWFALHRGEPSLREYFMSMCGMEYVLEVSQVKPTFPERLKSEFTEIEKLGEGAFGTVVKGEKDGEAYAVKEVEDPGLSASTEEERKGMMPWGKEMMAMGVGKLSPFICGLNRYWRQGESTFFQMPLCDADLHDWMSENTPGNRRRKDILHFLSDCSSGLRFLHDIVKKIHRDIKPGNIFLRTEADVEGITRLVAKIGDLGLATDRFNPKGEFYFERSQGGGAGAYLAPEIKGIALKTKSDPVVNGVPKYDEKIDIYALGGVFFDLLFLKPADAYSECRWLIYEKFRSEFPEYFPLIRRMLGGKEEKNERPPAYEVEDEAHWWLQEWLQTPEGAAGGDRESVRGKRDREKEKEKEAEQEKRKKMAAAINEKEVERMMKKIEKKDEELKRRRMEERELKRKEMALMMCPAFNGITILKQEFEILSEIGEGCYGKVYKVKKRTEGRMYSLECVTISGDSEKMKKEECTPGVCHVTISGD